MKDIVVFYHNNCTDGFGGAYVAWKKFKNKAEYLGVEHQLPPPKVKNKNIIFIDFCYPSEILKELKSQNKSILVLDHHISAKEYLKEADEYVFDDNHSGAIIAWNYFFNKKEIPIILKYIEDFDLWKFKLKNSKEIFAALSLFPYDFKVWDNLFKNFKKEEFKKEFIKKGKVILEYQNYLIQKLILRARVVFFENQKVLALNSPILASELGNKLASINPPFALVWSLVGERVIVSLRSVGDFDVSVLAQKYGGGGHKNAAGFSFDLKNGFPWKETNEKINFYERK